MIVRSKDPLTQAYLNSKGKIFLGSFIFFWGINQYVFYQTRLSLFIGIAFIVLGAMQSINGWKASAHYRNEYRKQEAAGTN